RRRRAVHHLQAREEGLTTESQRTPRRQRQQRAERSRRRLFLAQLFCSCVCSVISVTLWFGLFRFGRRPPPASPSAPRRSPPRWSATSAPGARRSARACPATASARRRSPAPRRAAPGGGAAAEPAAAPPSAGSARRG